MVISISIYLVWYQRKLLINLGYQKVYEIMETHFS